MRRVVRRGPDDVSHMTSVARTMLRRVLSPLVGESLTLPGEVTETHPELLEARWRRGGFPLRVGGWCLGQRTVAGITLGRTVFLAPGVRTDSSLLLHELAHVRQFARDKSFPLRYLIESIRRGYARNRYEVEADQFAQAVVRARLGTPRGNTPA